MKQPTQNKKSTPTSREDRRMANLAQELGVAGVQVLREQFGLTRSEAIQWFDATIERAHANRQASAHALKSACADKPRG